MASLLLARLVVDGEGGKGGAEIEFGLVAFPWAGAPMRTPNGPPSCDFWNLTTETCPNANSCLQLGTNARGEGSRVLVAVSAPARQ